jgi:metal-responsive CopG/Arc/MetJ family transcriptional regulator
MAQYARVTVALPKELWEKVKLSVPAGQRSRLVAEALRSELRRRQNLAQMSELRQFHEKMQAKYGSLPSSAEEIEAVRTERGTEHDNLH